MFLNIYILKKSLSDTIYDFISQPIINKVFDAQLSAGIPIKMGFYIYFVAGI